MFEGILPLVSAPHMAVNAMRNVIHGKPARAIENMRGAVVGKHRGKLAKKKKGRRLG